MDYKLYCMHLYIYGQKDLIISFVTDILMIIIQFLLYPIKIIWVGEQTANY